ncbi:MAG: hypothetical protein ACYCOU_07875 [Sulfobacillus sp.]
MSNVFDEVFANGKFDDEMTFDHGRIAVKDRGRIIAVDSNYVVRPFGYKAFSQEFAGFWSIDGVSCIEYLAFHLAPATAASLESWMQATDRLPTAPRGWSSTSLTS